MQTARAASFAGILACVAVLVAMAAPYVLVSEPGTGLTIYYASGPVGGGGIGFLSVLALVGFLAALRERTDPQTAAGVVLVVGVVMLAVALVWATAVDPAVVFSFPAAWMGSHRWVVVALVALVPLSAVVYARAVL